MRRWWFAAVALMATLTGCSAGLPEGADGDLTNNWNAPKTAAPWRPDNFKCFDETQDTTGPDDYAPINCEDRHLTETYYVNDLGGPKLAADAADDPTGPAWLAAYRVCAREADGYVDGRWRTGWLTIQPVLPDDKAWKGGARWVRCDISEIDDTGDRTSSTGSLQRAMTEPSYRLGCFNPVIKGDQVTEMTTVDCAKPHHAEFAGLWTAPKISLDKLQDSEALRKGCLSTIARYTKVPNDSMVQYRTGWMGFPGDDLAWAAGDRSVQCYLWLSRETLKGSYKGAGPKKFHVHYA